MEVEKEVIEKEVMNVKEAAAFLRCSVAMVYRDTALGVIPCVHRGSRVLFLRSKLLEWLNTMHEDVRTVIIHK